MPVSSDRLRELLRELDRELRSAGEFDRETRTLLSRLGDEIDEIEAGSETTAGDRAKELESKFAAEHPVAARIAREIADLLANMGI